MSAGMLERAVATIRAQRAEALAHGVELVGVMGFSETGATHRESYVEVAYRIVGTPSLLDLGGIQMDLQHDLPLRVDLVDLERLKPTLREFAERNLVRA